MNQAVGIKVNRVYTPNILLNIFGVEKVMKRN